MNKKEAFSFGVFLISFFLIGFLFFSSLNTDIKIQIDSGKTVATKVPPNFSLIMTIVLMFLSAVASVSLYYFSSDMSKKLSLSKKQQLTVELLNSDEKKLYLFVLEKGECLQKDLIYELGFTKAKVTRVLDKLEQKGVLVRVSYGKTNKIVAKE